MNPERTVLLVSPTSTLANVLELSLRRTGYRLTVAKTYQAAKSHLETAPQVLVTELKLGAYNGLHLALCTMCRGTRSVIIADRAFETEIEQLGAVWVSPEAAASGELPAVIDQLVASPPSESEWSDGSEGSLDAPGVFAAGCNAITH